MKKNIFILLTLLFCVSCSPNIGKYRVCETCYTEEDAIKTLKSYITNVKTYYKHCEMKIEIYDFYNIYYLHHIRIISDNGYQPRGCSLINSVIIRKSDCKVMYFKPNC